MNPPTYFMLTLFKRLVISRNQWAGLLAADAKLFWSILELTNHCFFCVIQRHKHDVKQCKFVILMYDVWICYVHYKKKGLLRRSLRVVKGSDDAQIRVKEGPVIKRDDAHLRRSFTTRNYDARLWHAMRIKEGPVIKEDDTHSRVVTLRRAC